jgi:hypothetical protein
LTGIRNSHITYSFLNPAFDVRIKVLTPRSPNLDAGMQDDIALQSFQSLLKCDVVYTHFWEIMNEQVIYMGTPPTATCPAPSTARLCAGNKGFFCKILRGLAVI